MAERITHATETDMPTPLERVEELFAFLQGTAPDGYRIAPEPMPKLTEEQAWMVIWYLGNLYWQVPDHIERCEVCGILFDTHEQGTCLDYGDHPYHFCDSCTYSDEYKAKATHPTPGQPSRRRGQ